MDVQALDPDRERLVVVASSPDAVQAAADSSASNSAALVPFEPKQPRMSVPPAGKDARAAGSSAFSSTVLVNR